jgi:hypothetical protein
MRKYSKMDKEAKNKLAGSPGENGGGQDAQKDLHSRTGRGETNRKPRKGWKEEVERDFQVLGMRGWRELVIDREKLRGIFRQAKAHSGLLCQRKKRKKKVKQSSWAASPWRRRQYHTTKRR